MYSIFFTILCDGKKIEQAESPHNLLLLRMR